MEQKGLYKFEIFIPLVAVLLLFLAQRLQIEPLILLIPILIFSLYFFPGKFLFKEEEDKNNRFWYLLSNYIFSVILANAAIMMFNSELDFLEFSLPILAGINIGLAIYYYFTYKSRSYMLLHLCFMAVFAVI